MGSINRLNYTVLGEPVNLAARLCGKAKAGEVLAAVPEGIALGESVELEAKGYSEKVRAVRVSGVGRAVSPSPAGEAVKPRSAETPGA